MKRLIGFLLFLVLAEDSACAYWPTMGGPLGGWVRPISGSSPCPSRYGLFDIILLGILIAAPSKGPLARPMKNALLLTVAGTVISFAWGLFHGGDFRHASWQTYLILSSVLLAFTVAATFRTAADFVGLAKWLLAVAIYRALMCWISYFTWGRVTLG